MKSKASEETKSKGSSENKKEVAEENKKPPVKESEKQPESEKKEITEELEKKMLEGQEHIEENPQQQDQQQKIEEEKPKERKQMIIKPRETYLQEKISKMNCNQKLMSNIKKELGNKAKTIIKEENVLITEQTKDLSKYLKKDSENKADWQQNYMDKKKYKEIKKLNSELNILKKNFTQLEENEKLLQDEGFIQLSSSQKMTHKNIIFDKSIKDQQLKLIQNKKGKLEESIKGIEYQIKSIMEEDKILSAKEKVKSFLENFERDKEIIEIRAKKYLKESKERGQRMQNDLNKLMEKRQKKIEEMEKKEKSKKDAKYEDFKKKEREIEQKHSKLSEGILVKYKPYINQKPEKTKKNYLYNKRYESFIKREEKLFKDQAEKNKQEKAKISYKFEDIDKFAAEYDEKLENRKYDLEQKYMDISQQWTKNREKLPKSNYQPSKSETLNRSNDEDGEKITPFQKYGREVRENHVPEIDEKKRKEREELIFTLENPTKPTKRYTLIKQRKNRILLKKRDKSKPLKNCKWELKLKEDENDKFEEIINQNLLHKPEKITLQPITRMNTVAPVKKPDYLEELINKKEKEKQEKEEKKRGKSSKSSENDDPNFEEKVLQKKSEKWEKEINNEKGSIAENINSVQIKAKNIDKEAELKEKLLKESGGIANNPELGLKVSNLLIDSIQAKINILKKMNEV
jgi:hypothetical protein